MGTIVSCIPVSLSVSGKVAGSAVSLAALLTVVVVGLLPPLNLHGCQIVIRFLDSIGS